MSYFRRRYQGGNSLRPVNRIKHVFDQQSAIVAGTPENQVLINTTDTPTLAATNDVETGSKVNGIYLRVEAYATTAAALANLYMIVFKNPGGNLANPAPNAVGGNDNKKYVIHQEMIMFQKQSNSNPRTLFNGVIVIPKLYRRNGPNNRLILRVLAPGVNVEYCVQCHYKEFR